jgi:hypothetical protein
MKVFADIVERVRRSRREGIFREYGQQEERNITLRP